MSQLPQKASLNHYVKNMVWKWLDVEQVGFGTVGYVTLMLCTMHLAPSAMS
jgi:hypothetical protein